MKISSRKIITAILILMSTSRLISNDKKDNSLNFKVPDFKVPTAVFIPKRFQPFNTDLGLDKLRHWKPSNPACWSCIGFYGKSRIEAAAMAMNPKEAKLCPAATKLYHKMTPYDQARTQEVSIALGTRKLTWIELLVIGSLCYKYSTTKNNPKPCNEQVERLRQGEHLRNLPILNKAIHEHCRDR